jgi:fucose permease
MNLQPVTVLTISGAWIVGMVLALLGSLKLALAKRLALSEDRVGGLLSALNLALIPMMLVSGILIDELGVRSVLVVGSLVTAVAVFVLAVSETYLHALGAALLAGAGAACLSTASTVLMAKAFFPGYAVASQNMGNVFFGLGALITPVLSEWLIRRMEFRRAVGILAILCLAPAVMTAWTAGEALEIPRQRGDLWPVLSHPFLWLAGLVFFLYGPMEASLGTWATTYLTDLGVRERRAAWLLSGFWLTFLAARLSTALLQEHHILRQGASEPWLLVGLALAAGVFLGNMAGARTGFSAATDLLFVGLFFGPIFPTLVGILLEYPEFKQKQGTAFGAMFAIGATSNLIVPPLIGMYARRANVQHAIRIPAVLALVLAVASLVLGLVLLNN